MFCIELQDAREPIKMVRETRHQNSPFSMAMDLARSLSADSYVATALNEFTAACRSSARAIQASEYQSIAVIGDNIILGNGERL
jgi:hypothetical protein